MILFLGSCDENIFVSIFIIIPSWNSVDQAIQHIKNLHLDDVVVVLTHTITLVQLTLIEWMCESFVWLLAGWKKKSLLL